MVLTICTIVSLIQKVFPHFKKNLTKMLNYILKLFCCFSSKKEYKTVDKDIDFNDYFD